MTRSRSSALIACVLALTLAASGCSKKGGGISIFIISTTSLPAATVSVLYNQTLNATGGAVPYTWAILSGALPNGLTLDPATGVISGTPTAGGSGSVHIRVIDANNNTANAIIIIVVNGGSGTPSVLTTSLPDGTQNADYFAGLSAVDGVPPYTWNLTGSLPAGLSLNASTGEISGIPTALGTTNFSVTVTDSAANTSASQALSITINAPVNITTTTLPDGTSGAAYSAPTLAATGGSGGYTWSIISGSLQTGLSMDAAGDITGTPTVSGSRTITVRVVDDQGGEDTQSLTLLVNPPVQITTTTLPDWTQGASGYNQTLTATGGDGTYTWSAPVPGDLPPGLTLSAAGVINTGAPTTAGSYTFDVTATDGLGGSDTQSLSILVNPPVTITTTSPLTEWTEGVAGYSVTMAATGGTPGFTWSDDGNLPAGLSMNAAGVISGTPTAAGTAMVDITATDSVGGVDTQTFDLTINPVPTITTTSPLPIASTNGAYNVTMTAMDGTGAYTWSDDGAWPNGMSMDAAGVITGTPTVLGPFTIQITVTDSLGASDTQSFDLTVTAGPVITTASLPDWTVNVVYPGATITATGGVPGYTFSDDNNFPTGITMTSGGVISGTPTVTGTFMVDITVTDSNTQMSTTQFTIVINPPPVISTTTLPDWTQNEAYSQTVQVQAGTGTAPFTFSESTPTLPSGLSLDTNTGVISGTPDTVETANFGITVTDAAGVAVEQLYMVDIFTPPSITTATLPDWTVGEAYTPTVAGTDGTTPYTFTDGGGVPTGLTLNSDGTFSGSPTTPGTYNFTVTLTDAAGATDAVAYTVDISAAVSITATSPLTAWTQDLANYLDTVTAMGGTGTLTWSNPGGGMPTNLNLDTANGEISGTPTVANTYNFDIMVTDSVGSSATVNFQIVISDPVVITTATLAEWTEGLTGYSDTAAATGGTGALTWTNPGGGLPPGLTLTGATISGDPTAAGTYNFDLTATDTVGASDTVQHTIVINDPVVITTATLAEWTEDGLNYSDTAGATGGTGALTWTNPGGGLPPSLILNGATGEISGDPTAAGTYNFDLTATDAVGDSDTVQHTIVINAPIVITSTSPLPDGSEGSPYSFTFAATGGTGALTWSVPVPADLPPGVTLSGDSLTGTATLGGTYIFNVVATDTVSATGAMNFQVFILAPLTITTTSPLADAEVNVAYGNVFIDANGGRTPYAWTEVGGLLPPGLAFSDNGNDRGLVSGTPPGGSVPQQTTVLVRVTDADSRVAQMAFTVTLTDPAAPNTQPVITVAPLQDGVEGQFYSQGIVVTEGNPPYSWNIQGADPLAAIGLSIDAATGVISGTPTGGSAGTYNFNVRVRDTDNQQSTGGFSITIQPPLSITTTSLPDGTVTGAYDQTLAANGGSTVYTWSIVSGSLPNGLTLNTNTGQINTGTTTVAGTFNFTVQVLDTLGATDQQALSITVNDAPTITTVSLPDGTQNGPIGYSFFAAVTDGTSPYDWSNTTGLPASLSINSTTGEITGIPTAAPGTYNVTLIVEDSVGVQDSVALTLDVNAPVNITTTTLPDGGLNQPYSQFVVATGGTAPLVWSDGGGLPTGLSLNSSTGEIDGTATAAGMFNFTVTATDPYGSTDSQPLQIDISAGPTITSSTPAAGDPGVNVGTHMVINFSERMDTGLTEPAITISPTLPNPLLFFWNGAEDSVTVVFDTTAPAGIEGDDLLAAGTTYTVSVGTGATAHSSGTGLPLASQVDIDFDTVSDLTPPGLDDVNNSPAIRTNVGDDPRVDVLTGSVTSVTLFFDEDMDQTRGGAFVGTGDQFFNAFVGFPSTELSVAWSDARTFVVTFMDILSPLPGDSVLEFSVEQIQDLSGNQLDEDSEEVFLVTAGANDGVAPTITGSIPRNGLANVSRETGIMVGLSEPMAPDILSHVTLTAGGAAHPALIGFSNEPLSIMVLPLRAWPASSTVTVSIDSTAEDNTGVATGSTLSISFTTAAASAADAAPLVMDPPFSSLRDGDTDLDENNFNAFFKFENSSSTLRGYVDGSPTGIAPEDVSIVETSTGIPIKGYSLFGEQSLFFVETLGGNVQDTFTGFQTSTGYTLTIKSTFPSSTGVVLGADIDIDFTTVAPAGNRRPFVFDPPESEYEVVETFGAEAFLGLQVCDFDGGDTVGAEAVDSPNGTFNPTLTTSFPGSCVFLQYNSSGIEAALITPGPHTLTFTADDGAGGHMYDIDSSTYRFPNDLGVDLVDEPDTTNTTPTFQWTGSAPAGATGMFIFVEDDSSGQEVYFAILDLTDTSHTIPADRALATGETYLWTVAYINFEGDIITDEFSQGFGIVLPDTFFLNP